MSNELIAAFFLGAGVSCLGQLPMGNLNMAATQLTVQEGFKNAWIFSFGVALVEIIYLRIAISSTVWLSKNKMFFNVLGWATVALFLVIGFLSLRKALREKQPTAKGFLINNHINRFLLGIMLSGINPLQIPFWFFWTATFIKNGALPVSNTAFNIFTLGAGCGTLTGQAVYIYGGNWIIKKLKAGHKILNIALGCIFILSACIQIYKILFESWGKN